MALRDARKAKERTYLELTSEAGRARLVVLAAEVGGRGNCTLPRSFGEGQGARVTPTLARSTHWGALSLCNLAMSLTCRCGIFLFFHQRSINLTRPTATCYLITLKKRNQEWRLPSIRHIETVRAGEHTWRATERPNNMVLFL